MCLRRDEQQVGQQVRDVVYPCAPVCASAAAAALRVWSIAPSSPLRDPGNPARTSWQPPFSRSLATLYAVCTQSQSKASWLTSAPEALWYSHPDGVAPFSRRHRFRRVLLVGARIPANTDDDDDDDELVRSTLFGTRTSTGSLARRTDIHEA